MQKAAKHSGNFLGHFFGSMIATIVVIVVIVLAGAYLLIAKLEKLDPFGSRTTISTTVVLGKLTKIEQVHVATRSYAVDVKITQSVGVIPCFFICNQMELKGSGTDDAVVNLATLSKKDVTINQSTDAVTVRMAPPVIGPADLDPAACAITSSHGVVNSATQGFSNTRRLPPALRGRGPDPWHRRSRSGAAGGRRAEHPGDARPGARGGGGQEGDGGLH